MADKQLSNLNGVTVPGMSDLLYLVQGGNSRKLPLSQLDAFLRGVTVPESADFTLENGTGTTLTDRTRGIDIRAATAASNVRFARWTAGPPEEPWTMTIRGERITPYTGNTFHHRLLVCRNSSSGRIVTFGDFHSTLFVQRWSSYSTVNATPVSVGTINGWEVPWRRIVNDGSVLSCQFSPDGESWHEFATEDMSTYLNASGGDLDQVGFGVAPHNPGNTQGWLCQHFTIE